MGYVAVVFDLFGTLAEFSAQAHDRVLAAMAAALVLPPQDFGRAWRTAYLAQEQGGLATLETALQQICAAIDTPRTYDHIDAASRLYRDFQRHTLTPRPEAIPMLTSLRQTAMRLA